MKTATAFLCRALEDWSKIKRGGKEKKQMKLKRVETMLPAPYKLAGVAHLSMPKAMWESGIREEWGWADICGAGRREMRKGRGERTEGAKCHLAYFSVFLLVFFEGGMPKRSGVCALRRGNVAKPERMTHWRRLEYVKVAGKVVEEGGTVPTQ